MPPLDIVESNSRAERLVRFAGTASVAVAITLILMKLAAWIVSDSVSVLASMADSALDFVASFITLVAIKVAQRPADDNHRLGHGKAEALAGFLQSLIIAGSAVYLIWTGIDRTLDPRQLSQTDVALFVMAGSLALTISLNLFQFYVVRRSDSLAIRADAAHYTVDIVATSATIAALATSNHPELDGVVAACIGAFVFLTAASIAKRAVTMLMDTELSDDERQTVISAVESIPQVLGTRNLRSWQSGSRRIVILEIQLDENTKLSETEAVLSEVRSQLRSLDMNIDATLVPTGA